VCGQTERDLESYFNGEKLLPALSLFKKNVYLFSIIEKMVEHLFIEMKKQHLFLLNNFNNVMNNDNDKKNFLK